MARRPRIEYENAFYHVTARGNGRGRIYRDDFDREMFLSIVSDAYDRFGFIIHAFVLMNNHYHFLIETPHANLSASMRHVNGVYTQLYNKRHKTVGHLFQGRYKAIVVDSDEYYLSLIRYIHRNPACAKTPVALSKFKYSGHMAMIDKGWGGKWKKWYHRDNILKEFGKQESSAIRNYVDYVNKRESKPSPFENVVGGYALGKSEFTDWLWSEFIDGKADGEIVGVQALRPKIETNIILEVIEKVSGVKAADIFVAGRSKGFLRKIRMLVLYIINKHTGVSQKEIGQLAGGMSAKAVSESVGRFAKELQVDEEINKVYKRVMRLLS
ncbi:MAG: transposase [Pseudomonadota bacterium]